MRLLLDSHTLLWYLSADSRLRKKAEKEISESSEVYVSIATLWELSIKHALGKLSLSQPPEEFFPKQLDTNGFVVLGVEPEHVFTLLPYLDFLLTKTPLIEC
jgi:PIN domain nuclease of toxin-antitoxin system